MTAPFSDWVVTAKRKEWATRGRLTHGDMKYVAATVLNGPHGAEVASVVARRFPLLLVDELQDTGWFAGRALVALLRASTMRSLLVGDPDQGIYGFGGADRALFDEVAKVENCRELPLRETHRCSRRVAAVATALARSRIPIVSREGAEDGRVLLFRHESKDLAFDLGLRERIQAAITDAGCEDVAVLVRKTAWAQKLAGTRPRNDCPLASGVARRLHAAVRFMEGGDTLGAARIVGRDLGHLILDDDVPTSDRLREAGIHQRDWRRGCFRLISEAATYRDGETWGAWLERMKVTASEVALRLVGAVPKNLGATFRRSNVGSDLPRLRQEWRQSDGCGWVVETIHKVKGLEFDAVVHFTPKPHATHARCPSKSWWDEDAQDEEREVAFVMASRARKVLILCVHAETYGALKKARPEFVGLFEDCAPIDRKDRGAG